jgi:hypothetical protein
MIIMETGSQSVDFLRNQQSRLKCCREPRAAAGNMTAVQRDIPKRLGAIHQCERLVLDHWVCLEQAGQGTKLAISRT